jgi:hypothetical protein
MQNPEQPNPYATNNSPQQVPGPPPSYSSPEMQGDGTGGLIPYKNPKALIAYYLGILSGLPLIGLPLGVASFVLGIRGLQDRKKNPIIKGSVHAWIGIGCGGFFAVLWSLLVVLLIVALIRS